MLTISLVDSIFKYYGVGFISLFQFWWGGTATSLWRSKLDRYFTMNLKIRLTHLNVFDF